MLSDIKRYLTERGTASLHDLALHLEAEPDAVRGMLGHWLARGRVRKLPRPEKCEGCCDCDPARSELYEWGPPVENG